MDIATRNDARTLAQFAAMDRIPAATLKQATEFGIHTVSRDEEMYEQVAGMFTAIKQLAAVSGTSAREIGQVVNTELMKRYAAELASMGITV